MRFRPKSWLATNTEYTFILSDKAKDLVGNPLDKNYFFTFKTAGTIPGVDVVIVIDKSAMMALGLGRCKEAAVEVINHLDPLTDRVAVVSFDQDAYTGPEAPYTGGYGYSLGNDFDYAKMMVNSISAAGMTNVTAGLMVAYEELSKVPQGRKKVVLVYTDWDHNYLVYPPGYEPVLKEITKLGSPIYTFYPVYDMVSSENERFITESGGKLFRAAEYAEYATISKMAVTEVKSNTLLLSHTGSDETFDVDSSLRKISLVLKDGRDLLLYSPDGSLVQEGDTLWLKTTYGEMCEIANPQPGQWRAQFHSSLDAVAKSGVYLDFPDQIKSGANDPLTITARLVGFSEVKKIEEASLVVVDKLFKVDGYTWEKKITLEDQGEGIYKCTFIPQELLEYWLDPGYVSHPLEIKISGKNLLGEPFVRKKKFVLYVEDQPPKIVEYSPVGKIYERQPTVSIRITDDLRVFNYVGGYIVLDGERIHSFGRHSDLEESEFVIVSTYTPVQPLSVGEHQVSVICNDAAGWQDWERNRVSISWSFEILDSVAEISSPGEGSFVGSGQINILGSARGEKFKEYKLEYASEVNPTTWFTVTTSFSPVSKSILGVWNTTSLKGGKYILRLTVGDTEGASVTTTMTVVLDNFLPCVRITNPGDGETVKGETNIDFPTYDTQIEGIYAPTAKVDLSVDGIYKDTVQQLFLYDDFNDGNADGWTIGNADYSTRWTVSSGKYVHYASNEYLGSYAYAGDESWRNYIFKVKFMAKIGGGGAPGTIFRMKDTNNYYRLTFPGDVVLEKIIGGVSTTLASQSGPFYTNTLYEVKVSLTDHQISVKIYQCEPPQTQVASLEVLDFSLIRGKIGLYSERGQEVHFDDVEVINLDHPYDWFWDTTLYSDGEHTIRAVAYDIAGNSAEASIKVITDNTPPRLSNVSASPEIFSPNSDGVKDKTEISCTFEEELVPTFKIYDSSGNLLRTLFTEVRGILFVDDFNDGNAAGWQDS
ncbi:MAG TPA: hypothetical protein DHV62_02475 [Elusimicrobia bacterium]|nr:hypothetical protein [Elusimicrobiota bacterium]